MERFSTYCNIEQRKAEKQNAIFPLITKRPYKLRLLLY